MARGIDLGDVTFGLNADTAGLDRALAKLRNFGQEVNKAARSTEDGAAAMAAAMARQERVVANAFQKVQDLNRSIRESGAPTQQIANLTTTYRSLTDAMTSGVLDSVSYGRAQTQLAARLAESKRALSDNIKEREREYNLSKAWNMAIAEDEARTRRMGRLQSQAIAEDARRIRAETVRQTRETAQQEAQLRRLGILQMRAQAEDAIRSQGKWHEALHNLGRAVVLVEGPLSGLGARMTVLSALFESSAFKMALFVAGAATMAAGVGYAANAAVRATIQWQQWEASMVAASGAHSLVATDMKYIVGVSREFGQSIEATIPSWTSFATAARLSGMSLKEQKVVFESFMTAGAALHWNTEKIGRAFLALEQILSKGAPQMQEVRLQLGQVLPGAFALAARGMQMTTAELSKAMEQGKIKAREFVLAMSQAVAQEYRSASTSGKSSITSDIQRFHIETFMLARAFDEVTKASGIFHTVVKTTNNLLQAASENMGKMITGAVAVAGALTVWFAPSIITGIAAVTKGLYGAGAAMLAFGAASATNPFIAVATLLLRIAAAVGVGAVAYDMLNKKQDETIEGAKRYADALKKDISQIQDVGTIDAEVKSRMAEEHRKQLRALDEEIRKQEEIQNAYKKRTDAQKRAAEEVAEANKRIPRQYRGLPGFENKPTTQIPVGPSAGEYNEAVRRHKEYLDERKQLEEQWGKVEVVPVKPKTEDIEKEAQAVEDFLNSLRIHTAHANDSGSKYLKTIEKIEQFASKNASKLGGWGSDKMVKFMNEAAAIAKAEKDFEDSQHESQRNNERYDELFAGVEKARTSLEALGRSQREQLEVLEHETGLLALNNDEREIAVAKWNRQRAAMEAYRAAMAIMDTDARAAALADLDSIREMDNAYLEGIRRRQAAEKGWAVGAAKGMQIYLEEAYNTAKSTEQLFVNAFRKAEDALTEFTMKGKLDIRGLFESIATEYARIQWRKWMTEAMDGVGGVTGGGGGFLGGLLGSAGTGSNNPDEAGSGLLGWLSNIVPKFDTGTSYVPHDMLAYVHKGERIETAAENAKGGSRRPIMVSNTFVLSNPADRRTQMQVATSAGLGLQRALARNN